MNETKFSLTLYKELRGYISLHYLKTHKEHFSQHDIISVWDTSTLIHKYIKLSRFRV